MTIQEAYQRLRGQLADMYEEREAMGIAELVIENVSGLARIERVLNKNLELTEAQVNLFEGYSKSLLNHVPVQYVLHEAWFAGMKFYVDENVLIPRPETEELADWIMETVNGESLAGDKHFSVMDIGTGSGCIPVAIKKKFVEADVYGMDVSIKALDVAKRNALYNNTTAHFKHIDILDRSAWQALSFFDIIVSNPPYITQTEAADMKNNVLNYEPHIALFVPDNDPLLFYNAIADFALQHLAKNGLIFFEINEAFGKEVAEMLIAKGFVETAIKKDLQGKERMVRAKKIPGMNSEDRI